MPVSDADGDNVTDAPTEAVDYICFKRARMKYANSTKQYYGMNGKGISEVIGEGIQSTSEAVLDFLEDLIY